MTSLIRPYYLQLLCETVVCAQVANGLGLSHPQPLGPAVVSQLERNMFSLAELHSHVAGMFSAVRSNAGVYRITARCTEGYIRLRLPKLHAGKQQNETKVASS